MQTNRISTLKNLFSSWGYILFLIVSITTNAYAAETSQTGKSLKEAEFLGLKLVDANINSVRAHLWDIGGFMQAKSTIRQRNIDKFYPWSTIRDSYYVSFQYNHAGNVVSVVRLFRPYSTEQANKYTQISTKDVALQLIEQLGKPSHVQRKGWGGTPSYTSYIWQDDEMKITVDREGSEYLGNVFIKYEIKNNKRYEVIKNKQTGRA